MPTKNTPSKASAPRKTARPQVKPQSQPRKSAAAPTRSAAADVEAVMRAEAARAQGEPIRRVPPVAMNLTEHENASYNHEVAQKIHRDMPSFGPIFLEAANVETVDGPDWKDKAAELAFLEEPVIVRVAESTDKNASHVVETWVNGIAQRFWRGQPQVVKRKFVAALASAKETAYSQEHYQDGNGLDAIRNHQHTAPRYPFTVLRDDNPRGEAWLTRLLAQA